jgi:hypothetical protein
MKLKVFEVILHKFSSGKLPAGAWEEELHDFLAHRPSLHGGRHS